MKYTLTYRDSSGELKTLTLEGGFTLLREGIDVGSINWDGPGELVFDGAGEHAWAYDDEGITHLHTLNITKDKD